MAQDFIFVPIYYGRSFVPGPGQGSFTWLNMDGSLVELSNSTYFDGLIPFGLGTVAITSSRDVAPTDPPASWTDANRGFTNDDVARFIVSELDAGRVPTPDDFEIPPAYVVFLKQGCFSKDHGDDVGYHYSLTYKGQQVACAWVMQGNDLDGTTPIASHELVEIISSTFGYGERADPCNHQNARINGVLAEAYESAAHTCVVPHVVSNPLGGVAWMAWKGIDGDTGIYYSWLNSDWQRQIRVPGVGTSDSPAICAHDRTVFMAWKGIPGDSGIWMSQLTDIGWALQQPVAGVGTSSHPALTSFGGVLYMAWKGADDDEGIWWTHWIGDHFAPQQNIPGRATSTGVDLFAEAQLHMAWKGAGNDTGIYAATLDPATGAWSGQSKVPGVGTSDSPSMAAEPSFIGDPDKVLMTWKGIPGDGGIYQAIVTGDAWSPQEHENGVGTGSHPALVGSGGGAMWRAWKGVDGDSAIWWSQGDEGITWTPQQPVPGVGTSHGPALTLS
jgi:hypothetical protein